MKEGSRSSREEIDFNFEYEKWQSVSIFTIFFSFISKFEIFLLVFGVIGAIGNGLTSQLTEYLVGDFLTELTTKQGSELMSGVKKMSCIYVAVAVGSFISCFLMMSMFTYLSRRLGNKYKVEYFKMLMDLDQTWFDLSGKTPFELSSQVVLELESIKEALGSILGNSIGAIAAIIMDTILGLYLHWKFALVVMCLYPFWLFAELYIVIAVEKSSEKKRKILEKVGGYLEEILYKIKTVASFGNFEYEKEKYSNELRLVLKEGKSLIKRTSGSQCIVAGLVYVMVSFGLGFGGLFLARSLRNEDGDLTFGKIYSTVSIVSGVGYQIIDLIPNLRRISECCSSAKLFFELRRFVQKRRKAQLSAGQKAKITPEKVNGKITFQNVTFSYPRNTDINVLNNFSIEIPSGKITALVGESGCGKSTIVNLIEKIYAPKEGKILLDDSYDIQDLDTKFYRDQIGYVPQEPILFNDSIKNNVIFGRSVESEEEVLTAIKRANALKFINSLPEGVNNNVGIKGGKLSGGQKQRIAIARAILKNPKILIFDEATSALDSKSEKQIQKSINNLKGEMTMIIIAHRLKTIKKADHIIFLGKQGAILEEGNHSQLMEKKGKYHDLYIQGLTQEEKEREKNFEKSMSIQSENNEEPLNTDKIKISMSNRNLISEENSLITEQSRAARNEKKSYMRKFFQVLSLYKLMFISGIIFSLLFGIITPLAGTVYAAGMGKFNSSDPDYVERQGRNYALYFVIFSVGSGAVQYIRFFSFDYLGEKLNFDFKNKIFATYLRLHLGYFDIQKNTPGNLVSQMNIKTAVLNGVVFSLLSMIIQCFGNFVCSNVLGFYYDWRVALITLAFFPIVILINYLLIILTSKNEKENLNNTYGDVLSENLCNILTIKSFNVEENSQLRFKNAVYSFSSKDLRYANLNGIFYGLTVCFTFIIYSINFYVIGKFYHDGSITVEDFLKCFRSLMNGFFFIGIAMKYIKDINQMKEAMIGLFNTVEIKSEIDPENQVDTLVRTPKNQFKGKIEFRNVTFAYPTNKTHNILKGVSFVINPGEKIGFVGESGAGKSTITQLIERFYEPTEGEILIDDVNIKNYDLKSLRKMISFVQQEPALFSRSASENIQYGNLEASREKIVECAEKCKIAQKLEEKVCDEKDKENAVNPLSGGEKQRIAIARALIREPKILLLDEATSALDNKTQNEVQDMLDQIIKEQNLTVIVIAHRLRAVQECDKCFLMENGTITKDGKIDELKNLIK